MVSLNHMKPDNRRDTLGRRPRDRRISTGKRVTPQERDLIWFQKLHEHGPLSSSYLHAFTKHLRSSEKRARDRLTDLFNESNTPHKGAYLERPWQQFQTYDARYQELVYDLAPAGEKALKQAGLWHTYGHVATGPWVHKYMVACITASIELETLENPNLTYIPGSTILERAGTTLRYEVPFINPVTGYEQTVDLIPDACSGLSTTPEARRVIASSWSRPTAAASRHAPRASIARATCATSCNTANMSGTAATRITLASPPACWCSMWPTARRP
jgi:hypothetical protein